MLIPDKLATAMAINKEHLSLPDSGAFLLVLVINLLKFYTQDKFQRRGDSISRSLEDLRLNFEFACNMLDIWNEPDFLTIAQIILDKCDVYYLVCQLYLKFLHPEILSIQRDRTKEPELGNFESLKQTLQLERDKLKNEFAVLTTRSIAEP